MNIKCCEDVLDPRTLLFCIFDIVLLQNTCNIIHKNAKLTGIFTVQHSSTREGLNKLGRTRFGADRVFNTALAMRNTLMREYRVLENGYFHRSSSPSAISRTQSRHPMAQDTWTAGCWKLQ